MNRVVGYTFLGILATALLEVGLFFLLKLFGLDTATAYLVISVLTLVLIFAAGCALHLSYLQERSSEVENTNRKLLLEQRRPLFDRQTSSKVVSLDSRRKNQKTQPDELWAAASRLESTVRHVKRNTNDDFKQVTSRSNPSLRQSGKTATASANPFVQPNVTTRPTAERSNAMRSVPLRYERPWESMSQAELIEELDVREKALASLILKTKKRINALEMLMENRLHTISGDIIRSHISAKRIINALDKRLEKVHQIADSSNLGSLVRAGKVLEAELTIPSDSINALINTEEIPSLPRHEWEIRLDELLSHASDGLRELEVRTRKTSV